MEYICVTSFLVEVQRMGPFYFNSETLTNKNIFHIYVIKTRNFGNFKNICWISAQWDCLCNTALFIF